MSNVCIIPARGGSQRIPRKNIRMFHGQPIIAYSIEAARNSHLFDQIVVSTDDEEIASIAALYGARTLSRGKDLSTVGTLAVIGAAARELRIDDDEYVCCVYATAPMLRACSIVDGFQRITARSASHCISVGTDPLCDAGQFYWSSSLAAKGEWPYWTNCTIGSPIDSSRVCDINTEEDWQRAERMYAALHEGKV